MKTFGTIFGYEIVEDTDLRVCVTGAVWGNRNDYKWKHMKYNGLDDPFCISGGQKGNALTLTMRVLTTKLLENINDLNFIGHIQSVGYKYFNMYPTLRNKEHYIEFEFFETERKAKDFGSKYYYIEHFKSKLIENESLFKEALLEYSVDDVINMDFNKLLKLKNTICPSIIKILKDRHRLFEITDSKQWKEYSDSKNKLYKLFFNKDKIKNYEVADKDPILSKFYTYNEKTKSLDCMYILPKDFPFTTSNIWRKKSYPW